MADFVVLQNVTTVNRGSIARLKAADIISDEDFDVNELLGAGVPVLAYTPATMETSVQAFQTANKSFKHETLIPVMTSFGAIPSAAISYDNTTSGLNATTVQAGIDELAEMHSVQNEPTGFPVPSDSAVTTVAGTRTLSITPTGASFDVWLAGIKHTFTSAQNVVWPNTEGRHYFYFDSSGTLQTTTTFITAAAGAIVYLLYWDATNSLVLLSADEHLHGLKMDQDTHLYLHESFGTRWISGVGLGSMVVDGGGTLDTEARFAVADGVIRDEDIRFLITDDTPQDLDPIAQIPVFYLEGASPAPWRKKVADDYPIIFDGTGGFTSVSGRIAYNEDTGGGTFQLTEVSSNNRFVLSHIYATNSDVEPVIAVCGQNEYTTINAARAGADVELLSIKTTGLPIAEFTPIATVIYQTSDVYSNTPLAIIRSTSSGDDYVDWRGSGSFGSGGTSASHGTLTELDQDQHPGYAWTLGRAGSQSIAGGIASGESLSLESTTHGTKGPLNLTGSTIAITGDISTAAAQDWDLIDNTASALSFDAGLAGILEIDTVTGFEKVKMSGGLDVAGIAALSATTITVADTENQVGLAVAQNDVTNNPVAMTIANAGSGNSFVVDTNALIVDGAGNVSMAGDLMVAGHSSFGATAAVDAAAVISIFETLDGTANNKNINSWMTLAPSAHSAGFHSAFQTVATATTGFNYTGQVKAATFIARHSGTGTVDELLGLDFTIDLQAAGTATVASAIQVGGGPVNAGSSVGTFYGANFLTVAGSGSATNVHAIRIADQTKGSTLNRAITSGLGECYFGDNTFIAGSVATLAGPANTSTGTINDVSTDGFSYLRFTGGGAVVVTGFANGSDGKDLEIINRTGNTVTLNNQDAGSSAANRIITGTGGNLVIANDAGARLKYDATTTRWQVMAT
jgi:hypothetical protein